MLHTSMKHLPLAVSLFFVLSCLLTAPWVSAAQPYYVYVASESADEVALVAFDGQKARAVETVEVGRFPTEMEGPHGLTVSPDGKYWFVSVAHGQPFGQLYKYRTRTNELVGETQLGMFPASMEIAPASGLLYVVNFNLHGDPKPSTVSVVDPNAMEVVTEIPTGVMPHGSRISPDGTRQYHVSMMTDELVEVNTLTQEVSRRLNVAAGSTAQVPTKASWKVGTPPSAKPTWADPHPQKPLVYVANNGADEVVEVNTKTWTVTRRFKTGAGPYNLEVTNDGQKLVVSYKGSGETGVWELSSGQELARIPNSRLVTHGVATSPDSRYAFISVEGKGGEPGAVDVISLNALKRVATAEVGQQAGGITFWKAE